MLVYAEHCAMRGRPVSQRVIDAYGPNSDDFVERPDPPHGYVKPRWSYVSKTWIDDASDWCDTCDSYTCTE